MTRKDKIAENIRKNSQKPVMNKSMQAARRSKGAFIIKDPTLLTC